MGKKPIKSNEPVVMDEVVVQGYQDPKKQKVEKSTATKSTKQEPPKRVFENLREEEAGPGWTSPLNGPEAGARALDKLGDLQRTKGNEAGAVAAKLGGGALRLGGVFVPKLDLGNTTTTASSIAGSADQTKALALTSEISKMAVDHAHNPNMIMKWLAEEGFGRGKTVDDRRDSLIQDYKEFKNSEMNVSKQGKTAGGKALGHIGRLVANTAAGAEVYVEGGRPQDRFADLIKAGGTTKELASLMDVAAKNDAYLDPNDYILALQKSNKIGGKELATKSVETLKTVLQNGGSSDPIARDPSSAKHARYIADAKEIRADLQTN